MKIKTKVVIWDFDEVICRDSEEFKVAGFNEVFASGSPEALALTEAGEFFAHGKGDRFDMFCRVFGVTDRYDLRVTEAGVRFNRVVEKKIRARGIHEDDRQALAQIASHSKMHIVSNTPERPLRANIKYFEKVYPELSDVWDLVLGTPVKKPVNLKIIRDHMGCSFSDITMIGDGENDMQAALDAGCHFIGVTTVENKERWSSCTFPKVNTISELF